MTLTCKSCDTEFESESKLKTHVLLKHPKLARSNSEDYSIEMSDGYLDTEVKAEKGEQFGYR